MFAYSADLKCAFEQPLEQLSCVASELGTDFICYLSHLQFIKRRVDAELHRKKGSGTSAVKRQLAGLSLLSEGVFELSALLAALSVLSGGRSDIGIEPHLSVLGFAGSMESSTGGASGSGATASSSAVPTMSRAPSGKSDSEHSGSGASVSATLQPFLLQGARLPCPPGLEALLSKSSLLFDVGLHERHSRYTTGLIFQVQCRAIPLVGEVWNYGICVFIVHLIFRRFCPFV